MNAIDPRDMTSLGDITQVKAAIERSRIVGALDAFVRRHPVIVEHAVRFGTSGGQAMYMCEFRDADGNVLEWVGGDNEDEARAAAAIEIAGS